MRIWKAALRVVRVAAGFVHMRKSTSSFDLSATFRQSATCPRRARPCTPGQLHFRAGGASGRQNRRLSRHHVPMKRDHASYHPLTFTAMLPFSPSTLPRRPLLPEVPVPGATGAGHQHVPRRTPIPMKHLLQPSSEWKSSGPAVAMNYPPPPDTSTPAFAFVDRDDAPVSEIGRASCRERVS